MSAALGAAAHSTPEIAQFALEQKASIFTGDFGFADIRKYPPANYYGIVVFEFPRNATACVISGQVERFLRLRAIVDRLPGHLAIVSPARVRLRPP
jgi:hypothetical protein